MWFDSWTDLIRVVLVGAAAYVFLIVTLRVSGRRTLSQLSAFDFIVTVALGSTLATILLSSDVSWTEGVLALVVLVVLQYVVARLAVTTRLVRRAITATPAVLVADGAISREAIHANRITEEQLLQAIRSSGYGDLDLVAAVVLETNGTMSVIGKDSLGSGSAIP